MIGYQHKKEEGRKQPKEGPFGLLDLGKYHCPNSSASEGYQQREEQNLAMPYRPFHISSHPCRMSS